MYPTDYAVLTAALFLLGLVEIEIGYLSNALLELAIRLGFFTITCTPNGRPPKGGLQIPEHILRPQDTGSFIF